jgi:predicted PurR-regulated permease PerM
LEKQIQEYKKEESKLKSDVIITNRHMVKFWLMGLFVVFLGYLSFMSLDIIYLILTAYIISIAMEAIVDIFQKRRIGR